MIGSYLADRVSGEMTENIVPKTSNTGNIASASLSIGVGKNGEVRSGVVAALRDGVDVAAFVDMSVSAPILPALRRVVTIWRMNGRTGLHKLNHRKLS